MSLSIINASEQEADVVIIGAAYEKTASSRKGTVNGPKAIITCLDQQIEMFDRGLKAEVVDKVKIAYKDLGDLEQLTPEQALDRITAGCAEVTSRGQLPFLLGGEHSVSLGLFTALKGVVDPTDTTIVQIDAHCDLRDDDSDYADHEPSRYAHSCVLRRGNELGYPLVQVGIRTYSADEYAYFSDATNNITVFEWGNNHATPTIDQIINSIKTKNVYLTIDVDGFDPAHMPGTGTPVQGGLEWWYGISLIESIIAQKNLVGVDIVEVSPMPDSVLTEYGAAQLCYSIIAKKFQERFR